LVSNKKIKKITLKEVSLMKRLFPSLVVFFLLGCIVFADEEVPELNIGEVVVTATKEPVNILEAPSLISVVHDKDIEKKNVQAVDQAVANLLGVYNRRGKGLLDTLAAVSLQGMPKQERTLVLVNGIPVNDPYFAGVRIFEELQPEDVERIEVARGPFSSLYGGYAMGGVVNIFTKLPEERIFRFKLGYGSSWKSGEALDNLRNFYLSYGNKFSDKFRLFFSYGKRSTDGYPSGLNVQSKQPPTDYTGWIKTTDPQGNTRYIIGDKGNNWMNNKGLNISLAYNPGEKSQIIFTRLQGEFNYGYGEPNTYLRDKNGNPVWGYGTIKEGSFLDGSGGYGGNVTGFTYTIGGKVNMKISYGEFDSGDNWYITPDSSATRSGGPGKLSLTNAGSKSFDAQWSFAKGSSSQWLFGLTYSRDHSDTRENKLTDWKDRYSLSDLTYQSMGKSRRFAIYLQNKIDLSEKVGLYIGGRGDWWRTYDGYVNQVGTQGYPKEYEARSDFAFSPKLAIVVKRSETTYIKGSIGKAFRSPTLYELYRTWTSGLTGITYAGNPGLKPEKVTSFDLSYQHFLPDGELCICVFRNNMSDLIYLQDVQKNLKMYNNLGKAMSEGIGFEWRKILGKDTFFTNFTLLRSEVTENIAKPSIVGKKLTALPHKLFNIGLTGNRGRTGYSIIGQYVGKVYNNDDNTDIINGVYGSYDPYFLVNFKLTYNLSPKGKVAFSIDNLFNRDYYYYYKAPGREWLIEYSLEL